MPTDRPRTDTEFVASEGSHPSKGGRLEGPAVRCTDEPFAFYRLRFQSRFTQSGYYAVFFQTAAGENLVDDIYGGIEPSPEWTDRVFCFRGREGAVAFRLQFISHGAVAVRKIAVEVVDREAVCAWADRLYATLPPLEIELDADRWQWLPRTAKRLREGGAWRVVMLGDSIVNDTANSNWDALAMRQHPLCRLQVIASVRGSTGCWRYREPEDFRTCVTDRRPDLLLIGGISHREDLDAIRDVVRRARAEVGCEVLLLSGPMGPDWRPASAAPAGAPLPAQACTGDPFNARLRTLAQAEAVAFFDMHTAWHGYLGASQRPWQFFHRDALHANDRGKQILARLMARFFTEPHA